jgi:biotin synthase-related radical SAM superfamily protein
VVLEAVGGLRANRWVLTRTMVAATCAPDQQSRSRQCSPANQWLVRCLWNICHHRLGANNHKLFQRLCISSHGLNSWCFVVLLPQVTSLRACMSASQAASSVC